MRNKDIKKRLTQAVSNSVPDVLDDILMKCEKKKGFEKKVVNKKVKVIENKEKIRLSPRLVGAVAFVMIAALTFVGLINYNNKYKVYSTIEFDVNPSIEIELNKDEKIININALNKDAQKVLGNMDFKGVDLDIAVNALIGSMLKNGYLTVDQNSILVSVRNDDKVKEEELQKKISKEINEILNASNIEGSILTQNYKVDDEIKKISNDNNISEGKAELIKRIIDTKMKDKKGNLYTAEELSKLSINELKLLLEEKETNLKNVNTSGNASSSSYIGKEKAKSIAYENAGVIEKNVYDLEVELDADDGKLVYEVDFKSKDKEYEYEIDAKKGTVLIKEIEHNDDVREENSKNNTSNNTQSSNSNSTSNNASSKPSSYIGKEKAKSIALQNASVKEKEVKNLTIEFDEDDGKYYYDVEFKINRKEYSYEIDASTGKILEKEIDN